MSLDCILVLIALALRLKCQIQGKGVRIRSPIIIKMGGSLPLSLLHLGLVIFMSGRAGALRILAESTDDRGPQRQRGRRVGAPAASEAPAAEGDGGAGLRKFLLSKYKEGHMSAVDLTAICFHAMEGGAQGVGDLALNPDQNAHAAERLRRAMNISDQCNFYYIDLPVWDNEKTSART